jgi:hypothetical protein
LQQLVGTVTNTLSTAPKHENYKITAADIRKQISVTNDSVKKIMSKPVPPPPAPPKVDPAQPAPPKDM